MRRMLHFSSLMTTPQEMNDFSELHLRRASLLTSLRAMANALGELAVRRAAFKPSRAKANQYSEFPIVIGERKENA